MSFTAAPSKIYEFFNSLLEFLHHYPEGKEGHDDVPSRPSS